MLVPIWLPPLVRAVATAVLVVSASVLTEALGPFWGALVASLPVSTGPAYLFLAVEHGPDFIAASALSSLAANAATAPFLTIYGLLAANGPVWRSLGLAVAVWVLASLAIRQLAWTPATALLLNGVAYGAGWALSGAIRRTSPAAVATRRRWFDLPVRAVLVASFVSAVVSIGRALGPGATGVMAVFPISLCSLIVILHPRIGGAATALLAVRALLPMLGFGLMLLVLHEAAMPWGVLPALGAALAMSAVWSSGLLLWMTRARRN